MKVPGWARSGTMFINMAGGISPLPPAHKKEGTMLLDFNIPPSAIAKLSRHIDPNTNPEDVINMLMASNLESFGLIPYEIKKINDLIYSDAE
ncbi:hypothetical protein ACFLWR_02490 [Chloroflexota bacterium]